MLYCLQALFTFRLFLDFHILKKDVHAWINPGDQFKYFQSTGITSSKLLTQNYCITNRTILYKLANSNFQSQMLLTQPFLFVFLCAKLSSTRVLSTIFNEYPIFTGYRRTIFTAWKHWVQFLHYSIYFTLRLIYWFKFLYSLWLVWMICSVWINYESPRWFSTIYIFSM